MDGQPLGAEHVTRSYYPMFLSSREVYYGAGLWAGVTVTMEVTITSKVIVTWFYCQP